jgi:arylsulfatase A-like enzyme
MMETPGQVPWMPQSVGKRSRALVELVDIYKTVSEVMGLPLPDDTIPIDGESLMPILADPEHATTVRRAFPSWKRSILTEIYLYYHACSYQGNGRN